MFSIISRAQGPRARRLVGAVALVAGIAALPASADQPAPGYQLALQPSPAAYAVTCSLPGGDVVTFDGLSVDRWTPAGGYVRNLATLPGFVFASFVIATPDGSAVVFGESSNGDLLLASSDGSGVVALVQLAFNYDAAWLPGGDLIVSAAVGGFGAGNDLYRVTLSPPGATHLGHIDGASGPVAVGPGGELYYATQSAQFPPPPGSTDVLRWPAPMVQAGTLNAANAQTVGAGFEGASSLAVDPITGRLYMAETHFGLALYRIVRVGPSPASSPPVVDQGLAFLSDIEIRPGRAPGSFDPWQPDDASELRYNTGLELGTVRSRRPLLSVSGPGTTGAGPVTFSVTGGVPSGSMYVLACPQGAVQPTSSAHLLPTFLFVTPFTLKQTRRGAALLPLDASGSGSFVLQNPGNLQGVYAWQFLVGNASGVLLGSTAPLTF